MNKYEFDLKKVYSLKKNEKYDEAINLIFDEKKGGLKKNFNYDKNHSWYVLGDLYFNLNLINKAIVAFKKSVRAYSKDWQALLAVGNCYSILKKNALARRYFFRALEFKENDPSIFYNIGNSYFDQEKYIESIDYYRSAIKYDEEGSISRLASKNLEKAQLLASKALKK